MAGQVFRGLTIEEPDAEQVDYVVRRMRDQDAREVYGTRWSADPLSLASEIWASWLDGRYAALHVLHARGRYRPVALVGVLLTAPHAGWAHMIATPDWRDIARDATRFIRQRMIPDLMDAGMRRVELRALASWTGNIRWLERLGARFECECPGLGRDLYLQLAWTDESLADNRCLAASLLGNQGRNVSP